MTPRSEVPPPPTPSFSIAEQVRDSRHRIRAVDGDAYDGFVTDAACFAVAGRLKMKATDVLRAYRSCYPSRSSRVGIPLNARKVSDEGKAAA